MNLVKHAVSATLLATASLAATTVAMATTDPSQAPGDLMIAVYNTSTNTSIVQDLDVTYSQLTSTSSFESASGYTTSFTIDSSLSTLTSDLGSGTYNYQIFAVDNSTPNNYAGNSAMLSLKPGQAIPQFLNSDIQNNAINSIQGYLETNLPGSTTLFKGTATPGYWAAFPSGDGYSNSFTLAGLANIGGTVTGSSLNLVHYLNGSSPNGDDPTNPVVASYIGNSQHAGVFTLSGDTLTYTLAAAGAGTVPLPAAVWLLVSGLLGFGAVGRRRDATPVAA